MRTNDGDSTSPSKAQTQKNINTHIDAPHIRQYHEQRDRNEEHHQKAGGLLKPMIFGGLDGILTSFAIVAGAAGGKLSTNVVLILGFSNIVADALSMGVGEFLSSKAENEWILSERKREVWELENFPEGEIKEMVEIYEERGMSHEDAVLVINTMAKYKDFFVDVMMTQELELQVPDNDHVMESFREGKIAPSHAAKTLVSKLTHVSLFRYCNVLLVCFFWSTASFRLCLFSISVSADGGARLIY